MQVHKLLQTAHSYDLQHAKYVILFKKYMS
jgi:hypothetical protein